MAVGAAILLASASFALAGVHVVLDDGTKMTVESYWTDGDQVHLITGDVDMIVTKARIKLLDEFAPDPEPYEAFGSGEAKVDGSVPAASDTDGAVEAAAEGEAVPAEQPVASDDDADDESDAAPGATVAGVNVGGAPAPEPDSETDPDVAAEDDAAAAVAAAERANPTASFWIPPSHRGSGRAPAVEQP